MKSIIIHNFIIKLKCITEKTVDYNNRQRQECRIKIPTSWYKRKAVILFKTLLFLYFDEKT